MALPGISNANEFYSAHYLESVLAGDIKKVRERWAEQAREQLELRYTSDQRSQQIKEKCRQDEQKAIDRRFEDHERFVNEVMTIDPAPYLKLVAVLHRAA